MKPLELVIFDEYHGSYTRRQMIDGAQHVTFHYPDESKRFTDAELAAETYKAEAEFRAAAGYGYPAEIITECDRKRFILEQFATLPHYDEADR